MREKEFPLGNLYSLDVLRTVYLLTFRKLTKSNFYFKKNCSVNITGDNRLESNETLSDKT